MGQDALALAWLVDLTFVPSAALAGRRQRQSLCLWWALALASATRHLARTFGIEAP